MTPRTVMFALPQDMTIEEAIARKDDLRFTRIPIFGRSIDEVTGFVLKTDLLFEVLAGGGARTLAELKRDITAVPETMLLEELFETLLKNDRHIALVTDAYGGTAGVVTIEDVVETLLGEEIVDEADKIEDLQSYARPRAAGLDGARSSSIGPRVLNGLSIPRRIRPSVSGPSRV
jgi:CBS domain containing-hemolysin-like protein